MLLRGDVTLFSVLIDENGMGAGRTSRGPQSCPEMPDVMTLLEQGSERQRFRGGPVDALAPI